MLYIFISMVTGYLTVNFFVKKFLPNIYYKIRIIKYQIKDLFIKPNNPLFSKNDKQMFYKYLDKCKYYFEYGSGGSTYQASIRNNIKCIYSVESDYLWYSKLKKYIGDSAKINLIFCDMNAKPLTWANPGPNSTIDDWKSYSTQILKLNTNKSKLLDLILIDGRFRVACCLHCYNVIDNNCYIIFDDFLNRPQYHIVLDYFKIVEKTCDNKMVVLKKKLEKYPSLELKSKYEKIKE